ncbi:hypothetical protein ACTWP5_12915 [Streptomyces sp. 4N509B]|uniref:hypothetical protein n=1 Tax=Streptomyces sp. 4N509B TaxID=3457413 RepID=UPI003FD6A4B8
MTDTSPQTHHGRTGREETASVVAVVPDEAGFALMRRYRTFGFADHAAYLRHTEDRLRSLAERHAYTSVALLDPVGFADWCEREGLEPDSVDSRSRYAGEIAIHGAVLPYGGQPLGALLPRLVAEHGRWEAWDVAAELLAEAGACPDCGEPLAHCAFQRAAEAFTTLLERAAAGSHHLVATLVPDPGDGEPGGGVPAAGEPADGPLTGAVRAVLGADGGVRVSESDALVLCTVLAAGLATGRSVGLVLRSRPEPRDATVPERIWGWRLRRGVLRPLADVEIASAYATDARTGQPLPPEPGVVHHTAPALPPLRCPGGSAARPGRSGAPAGREDGRG